jgi:hypothetical protein
VDFFAHGSELHLHACEGTAHTLISVQTDALSMLPGKLTGFDKELSKSLDLEVQSATSEAELSSSPVGPLGEASRCILLEAL